MATIPVFSSDSEVNGTEESDNIFIINGDNNTLNGLGANDILSGSGGANTVLNGGDGADRLIGNQDDILRGGANSDEVDLSLQAVDSAIAADLENIHNGIGVAIGGAFVEDVERGLISFGTGNDTVTGSSSASIFLYGYDGNDHLTGDVGGDSMGGGNGVDVLDGLGGDDLLYAFAPVSFAAYNSSVSLGTPDDPAAKNFLNGGDGNDTMVGSSAQDFFDGGDGIDTVSYDPETEVAPGVKIDLKRMLQDTGGSGLDRFTSIENVDGTGGDDVLRGDQGANSLFGGVGNDFLTGGGGADTLRGGDGADRFVYKSTAAIDGDRIIDLDNGDFLDLRGIDADTTKGGNQAFKVVESFRGRAGELMLTLDTENGQTIATMDLDGDAVADATFYLNGSHVGTPDNFVL